MKVKLFSTEYQYEGDDNYTALLKGVTGWEEITQEQFNKIVDLKRKYAFPYILVRQLEQAEVDVAIADIISKADADLVKREANRKKYEKEDEARKVKALERRLLKAKKLLEENNKNN